MWGGRCPHVTACCSWGLAAQGVARGQGGRLSPLCPRLFPKCLFIIAILNLKRLYSIDCVTERSLCPVTHAQGRSGPLGQSPAESRPRLPHTHTGRCGRAITAFRKGWSVWGKMLFFEGEIRNIKTFSFTVIRQKRQTYLGTLTDFLTCSPRVPGTRPIPGKAGRRVARRGPGRCSAQQKLRVHAGAGSRSHLHRQARPPPPTPAFPNSPGKIPLKAAVQ